MGFKSKARKHSKKSKKSDDDGQSSEEKVGTKRCAIVDCMEWADKDMGGRSIAYDSASEAWGDNGLKQQGRRVPICRTHYKELKKFQKDDREFAY